jgi:hypothetical protein
VVVELTSTGADSGDSAAGGGSQSGGITNPFVGNIGSAWVDTNKSLGRGYRGVVPVGEGDEEGKTKDEAGVPSRLLAFSGLNERTANSDWPSAGTIRYGNEWLNMGNINTAGHEAIPKALALGAGVTVVAGVVNIFIRSMSFLGMFFSFPLWSRIDPVPVMLLANKEIKRRKEQAEKEEALENKGGHLGQVLDD